MSRVSVGIPVRNGGNYIAATIESILAQTHTDFELIICDNASSDSTETLCREYARRDSRIRYERNRLNIGAVRNYNRVFELSSGEYFKWSAHDDLIAPEFLEACVAELDRDPSLVLCTTAVAWIGADGGLTGLETRLPSRTNSASAALRFGALVLDDRVCADVFGLFRRDCLLRTRLMGAFIASDRIIRVEAAMLGMFAEVAEPMLFLRDHAARSVRALPAHHLRAAWFDPALAGTRVFPHWRIFAEYAALARRLPRGRQRLAGGVYLVRWLVRDSNWARMCADVLLTVWPGSWDLVRRFVK